MKLCDKRGMVDASEQVPSTAIRLLLWIKEVFLAMKSFHTL